MKKEIKQKKTVTSDMLIMLLIVCAALLVLVGFVAYNFGHSAGAADKARKAEEEVNRELTQMAEDSQKMEEKYADVYDLVVPDGQTHESEEEYDLSVFKKDYPFINYSGLSNWQVIIRNADGTSYVCADAELLNECSDKLYTYITPYTDGDEPANTISILINGEISDIMLCERIYFTSQQLKDGFQKVEINE